MNVNYKNQLFFENRELNNDTTVLTIPENFEGRKAAASEIMRAIDVQVLSKNVDNLEVSVVVSVSAPIASMTVITTNSSIKATILIK